jgi:hypothetical protein
MTDPHMNRPDGACLTCVAPAVLKVRMQDPDTLLTFTAEMCRGCSDAVRAGDALVDRVLELHAARIA